MGKTKAEGRRDKGDGSVYQRGSDGMWLAELPLPDGPDGKRRRKYLSSKTEEGVKEKLRDERRKLAKAGNLTTSAPTVAQWITLWLKEKKKNLKPGSYVQYEGKLLRHVVPSIGKIKLSRLTTDHIRKVHTYITDEKKLSTTEALATHRILAKCLTDAVREKRIIENVATQLDAPRKAISKRKSLTADEAATLLMATASDPTAAVHLSIALLTGMRPGERLGLTREQVDMDTGIITVSWQLQRLRWEHGCLPDGGTPPGMDGQWPCGRRLGGYCPKRWVNLPADTDATRVEGGLWLTRPKSRAGWREVPMAPPLRAVMARHLETTEPGMHGLVLHRGDEHGRPIDPTDAIADWYRWLTIAGLPRVIPYTSRHTTATLLHKLKVPDLVRQAILGHSDATVTAGYTHVADAETIQAMNQLGELLAPQIEP